MISQYTEPSNLALVRLMWAGVFHSVCNQPDVEAAKKEYMLIMCNLFGRHYLRSKKSYWDVAVQVSFYGHSPATTRGCSKGQKVLIEHDAEILRIFEGYALAFATKSAGEMGVDDVLPPSKIRCWGTDVDSSSEFRKHIKYNAIPVIVRSSFVENSVHVGSFASVFELMQTTRTGINLNAHAITSMSHLLHLRAAINMMMMNNTWWLPLA